MSAAIYIVTSFISRRRADDSAQTELLVSRANYALLPVAAVAVRVSINQTAIRYAGSITAWRAVARERLNWIPRRKWSLLPFSSETNLVNDVQIVRTGYSILRK